MKTLFSPFSTLVLSFAGTLSAQVDTITEARVEAAVTWLAADERGGRDTPSAGQEAAAEWLAQRFAAAGLQQAIKGSWFHEFTLPGSRFDPREVTAKLQRRLHDDQREITLVPGADVRLWRPADAPSGAAEACTVAQADDPVLQQLLRAESGRRPIVLEVAEDHPYWLATAGVRTTLGGVRAAARPVFLVRKGLLPALPPGRDEAAWAITWTAAKPEKLDVPLKNVVALLPGTDKAAEHVVVSAHYDHVGIGAPVGGDGIYNGADDDATGTTAVLLLAEAMAKEPPGRRSVLFVCFSAEEKGLSGSAAFVARPPVPLDTIAANVNIEMIGRPEPGNQGKAWITGSEYSDFAAIAAKALEQTGIEVVPFRMATMLFAGSDNYSFAKRGIVAHSLSAGSLHADYHRPSDEVGKLDIPHMTKIVRGLYDVVRAFADRDERPAWSEAGRERLERRR
jgi:hypothetical protein